MVVKILPNHYILCFSTFPRTLFKLVFSAVFEQVLQIRMTVWFRGSTTISRALGQPVGFRLKRRPKVLLSGNSLEFFRLGHGEKSGSTTLCMIFWPPIRRQM